LVILAVIVIILLIPIAVQVSYLSGVLLLRARVGFIRFTILPKKEKLLTQKQKAKKEKKAAIKAAKKEAKRAEKAAKAEKEGAEDKPGKKLKRDDILTLIKLGLKTLSSFRRHLDIDVLHLKLLIKSDDPFDCVTKYGYINAAIGSILPLLHRAFKIRDEDIQTDFVMEEGGMEIQGKFVASIQIWEALLIGISAGIGVLKWYRKFKKNNVQEIEKPVTT